MNQRTSGFLVHEQDISRNSMVVLIRMDPINLIHMSDKLLGSKLFAMIERITRCGFVRVGMALLEEISGGGL